MRPWPSSGLAESCHLTFPIVSFLIRIGSLTQARHGVAGFFLEREGRQRRRLTAAIESAHVCLLREGIGGCLAMKVEGKIKRFLPEEVEGRFECCAAVGSEWVADLRAWITAGFSLVIAEPHVLGFI